MAATYFGPHISRRRFVQGAGLAGLGLLAGCGRLPFAAPPPTPKVHRIADLLGGPPTAASAAQGSAFRQGLHELGYIEGQNLVIEQRYAAGSDQLAEPAAELVRLQPAVIVVPGVPAARAVLAASATIPIVTAAAGSDIVAAGLVASHARPGGTVTGLSTSSSLIGKQLQFLPELVPALSRVVVLFDATSPDLRQLRREPYEAAARTLGLALQFVGAVSPADLETAFEAAIREQADALFVTTGPAILTNQGRIAGLALQSRLPSMWQQSEAVGQGGLIAYGPNRADGYRRAAYYVDRILQGTLPADLPVEEPRKFDCVINLKTAQALGLSIPPHVLVQATEVIQ
jgi:putative tryptophan/tyrosine transport system substrate-binding protein